MHNKSSVYTRSIFWSDILFSSELSNIQEYAFPGPLVIGLIIGFILYEFFHVRSLIAFCALGSVLPDIVDKLLGHIVFGSSLDNGKIFFHSLVIVLLFFLTGLIVWKYYRSFSFLVVGFGIFLHQLVDMMFAPGFFYIRSIACQRGRKRIQIRFCGEIR